MESVSRTEVILTLITSLGFSTEYPKAYVLIPIGDLSRINFVTGEHPKNWVKDFEV